MLLLTWACPTAAQPVLQARTIEPRAYGYQVGDTLQRQVLIEVPDGLTLDTASLPRPGGRGQSLALRGVRLEAEPGAAGTRQTLWLDYQVFLSPPQVRTLEIAPITLRYTGQAAGSSAREQTLRIEAWPVTVAPLLPPEVSPRRGLGELQADVAPPLVDLAPTRQRLRLWAGLAALVLAWWAAARWAWPAWQRRHRPFGQAWGQLRRLPDAPDAPAWQAACRRLHRALDASAGQVVFEAGLADWLARQPAFAPLRDDLAAFLRASRQAFFAPGAAAGGDGAWLRGLCRRCCDAERDA